MKKFGDFLQRYKYNTDGNFAIIGAVGFALITSLVALGANYQNQIRAASQIQDILDLAVLSGASQDGDETQKLSTAKAYFTAHIAAQNDLLQQVRSSFSIVDGNVVSGKTRAQNPSLFNLGFNARSLTVTAKSAAMFEQTAGNSACLYILGDKSQALLINSGADIIAPECEIHVHSMQNPSFIMNAGSNLDISNLCVAGTQYIKNGGFISNWKTGCEAQPDPYVGTIIEPAIPRRCTTNGPQDGRRISLSPGVHCNVIFNGDPTIIFEPGLHIISGRMIANSGSTIIAEGVTFYYPNTDSEIRANGDLTMTATAPTSGPYKDILMFERTSDRSNNANKRPYIFNGSDSEHLEGVIYLPNRDVTYNSTTNIKANRTVMVFNSLIMNSANWGFAGVGETGSGRPIHVRLIH